MSVYKYHAFIFLDQPPPWQSETINTQSNRVVIISSEITRIFFNSMWCLDSHISTYFNEDTCDLFMLCIVLMCQLHRVDFIIVARFCSLFDLSFVFCSTFVFIGFFWFLLFIVQREKIQFWSWIVFQVFRSHCTWSTGSTIVQEVPLSSMQVNKHHTSDCTDFVLV